MNLKRIGWLFGVAVAVAVGFFAGRLSLEPGGPAPSRAATEIAIPVTVPAAPAPIEAAVAPPAARPDPTPEPAASQPESAPSAVASVMDTMALSGDFAQTAALYELAVRADVSAIKRYVDEAKSIGIPVERGAALTILFLRFSELDPDACIDYLYSSGLVQQHHLLHTIFNGWAKYDLEAAIARLERLRDPADQRDAAEGILRAYADADPQFVGQLAARLPVGEGQALPQALAARAQSDPAGALEAALQLRPNQRMQTLRWIASIWVRTDPAAALAHAETIDDARLRREFRHAVLGQFAQRKPEAALAMLDSSSPEERQMIVSSAISTLARHDPQQALKVVNGLDQGPLRQMALGNLILAWSSQDPRAAAAALAELAEPALRERYGYAVIQQYAQAAPQEALEWAERIEGHRGNLWSGAVNTIAQHDPGQALALAAGLEASSFRTEVMSNVLGTIAASDPLLAVEFVGELPGGAYQDQAVANIASQWAQFDPAAALEWVLGQPARTQIKTLSSIAYSMASHDVALAAGYVDRIPEAARAEWIGAVVQAYANRDPAAAADWIRRFRELPGYGHWLGTVAAGFAAHDPRAGARLIRHESDPERYHDAQLVFAQIWAGSDPAAAAKWWSNLPSERQDTGGVQAVVSQWQRYDREAAQKWVLRLRESEYRDAGIQALLNGTLDVAEAERLIRRIGSPEMREQAYRQQVLQLARFDRDGARELIRRADLSPEQRASLEQMLEQQSRGYY